MPRQFIKRFMPDVATMREHKHLRIFGSLLHDHRLWVLTRHSVAGGFFVGLCMAFVPVPFQMVLAAAGAIVLHVNLPISVALVWLTNPLTIPPLFYAAYCVGAWLLNTPPLAIDFSLSSAALSQGLSVVWQPFLLGCFVVGFSSGLLSYVSIHLLWRLMIIRRWRSRAQRYRRSAS